MRPLKSIHLLDLTRVLRRVAGSRSKQFFQSFLGPAFKCFVQFFLKLSHSACATGYRAAVW